MNDTVFRIARQFLSGDALDGLRAPVSAHVRKDAGRSVKRCSKSLVIALRLSMAMLPHKGPGIVRSMNAMGISCPRGTRISLSSAVF